jgi:hypothetical protein
MPTSQQDKDFSEEMESTIHRVIKMQTWALDKAIFWMENNLNPGDVFSEEKLIEWAIDNGYKKE